MKTINSDETEMRPSAALPPPRGNGSIYRMVRRLVIFTLGSSVLLIGIVMLVSPGPAFIVIPLGLAILATEFVWAARILHSLKERLVNSTGNNSSSRWHRFAHRVMNLFHRDAVSTRHSHSDGKP